MTPLGWPFRQRGPTPIQVRWKDGEPIEFSRDLFRADRTRIVVRTEGSGASRAVPGRARVVELHAQEAV